MREAHANHHCGDRDTAADRNARLRVINVDGTGERALTHGVTDLNAGGRDPDWSRAP